MARNANKLWADAIRMEALKIGRNEGEDRKKLNRLAVKLIDKALEGDVSALREIGDRLDGKAAQALQIGGDETNPIMHKVVWEHVKPDNGET